jgi:hypothetical protein
VQDGDIEGSVAHNQRAALDERLNLRPNLGHGGASRRHIRDDAVDDYDTLLSVVMM